MTIQQHTIDTPYMVGPVHCYTIEIEGDLVLFDTGPPTSRAKKYLKDNIDLNRLKYLFITHCHIDHSGLAQWLIEETDVKVYLPYRDNLKMICHDDRLAGMYDLLKELGFSGTYLQDLQETLSDGMIFPTVPQEYSLTEDGLPEHLGIDFVNCPGHSQSDLVYFNKDWAVTGDTLLKGVFQSPLLDVDLKKGERFNNYKAYCSTLQKLFDQRKKKICPGHRKNVESVEETLIFYISKMLDRVARLKEFKDQKNIAGIIDKMFANLLKEPFHMYLKASEIVFMQDFLEQPEILKYAMESIGLFETVAEKYECSLLS